MAPWFDVSAQSRGWTAPEQSSCGAAAPASRTPASNDRRGRGPTLDFTAGACGHGTANADSLSTGRRDMTAMRLHDPIFRTLQRFRAGISVLKRAFKMWRCTQGLSSSIRHLAGRPVDVVAGGAQRVATARRRPGRYRGHLFQAHVCAALEATRWRPEVCLTSWGTREALHQGGIDLSTTI